MEVILRASNQRVKKKSQRDFYWYDSDSKQMYHGVGGRMEFVYNAENKKSYPRLVNDEAWGYENNYDHIEKWASASGLSVVDKSPGYSVTLEIPQEAFDDISEALYRSGIVYDYEPGDLR